MAANKAFSMHFGFFRCIINLMSFRMKTHSHTRVDWEHSLTEVENGTWNKMLTQNFANNFENQKRYCKQSNNRNHSAKRFCSTFFRLFIINDCVAGDKLLRLTLTRLNKGNKGKKAYCCQTSASESFQFHQNGIILKTISRRKKLGKRTNDRKFVGQAWS